MSWLDKNIVILTGAGISAESGIRTFRDQNGLWEDHRIEDVATPEAFQRNPDLVYRFYDLRRAQLNDPSVRPNSAHVALAELEKKWRGQFLLVTQNVDDLHRRAGSVNLLEMHGQLRRARCLACDGRFTWVADLGGGDECPACSARTLRPDIVWFGENPDHLEEIYPALECADIFVAIGTSGQVYPAAAFVRWCPEARKIEINAEGTAASSFFDEQWLGTAGEQVPLWVRLLEEGAGRQT